MNRNKNLQNRRTKAIPNGILSATDIFVDRANNAEIWDVEGKRYLDFSGGIGAVNTGHCHPKIIHAVSEQLKKLTHSAFQARAYESQIALLKH